MESGLFRKQPPPIASGYDVTGEVEVSRAWCEPGGGGGKSCRARAGGGGVMPERYPTSEAANLRSSLGAEAV